MSAQIGFKRIHKVAYGFRNMIIKEDTLSENDLAAPHSGVGGFGGFQEGLNDMLTHLVCKAKIFELYRS